MFKEGQIRKDEMGHIYCISRYYGEYNNDVIYIDGIVSPFISRNSLERSELIAEYPTWQEAVNSKEFKE